MLCAEPKEHKRFRPGTRPGGIGFPAGRIGDRGDREVVYVPNVYVPFPAPNYPDALKKHFGAPSFPGPGAPVNGGRDRHRGEQNTTQSGDSRESCQGSQLHEPLFCESRFRGGGGG